KAERLPRTRIRFIGIALAITSHFDDPLGNDFAVEGVTKLALVRIRNAALCVTAKLAADVRFGSFATEALEALPQWMSASPPKATVGHPGGISSLSAISGSAKRRLAGPIFPSPAACRPAGHSR